MAPLLAPYNSSMKLGSGFNSFTQQLCVDNAVQREKEIEEKTETTETKDGVAQSVVFKATMIEKVSEITDALNISGALTIKYNNLIDGTGNGTFINSNKLHESDINFLIKVNVVNQITSDPALTKFNPIPKKGGNSTAQGGGTYTQDGRTQSQQDFTDVYGDCFISGFQEGGEFTAIVSMKVRDKQQKEKIAADAAVSLTTPMFGEKERKSNEEQKKGDDTKKPEADGDDDAHHEDASGNNTTRKEKGLSLKGNAAVNKDQENLFKENETTISVMWSGGGQNLKEDGEDWDIKNLRKAALRFPELVAKTPVRTYCILTPYSALKSYRTFHEEAKLSPLNYENAAMYTNILQEAFLEYKNLHKDIHLLQLDVATSMKQIVANPHGVTDRLLIEGEQGDSNNSTGGDNTPSSEDSTNTTATGVGGNDIGRLRKDIVPITTAFPATLLGLEQAKWYCYYYMNRIVEEVDKLAKSPGGASQFTAPFYPPLLFKQYLPVQKSTL